MPQLLLFPDAGSDAPLPRTGRRRSSSRVRPAESAPTLFDPVPADEPDPVISSEEATDPEAAVPLEDRLEWFEGSEIDVDVWCDFLDEHLPNEEDQEDGAKVRAAWAAWLAGQQGVAYDPPLKLPKSSIVLQRKARLALLIERAHRGEELWCPGDLINHPPDAISRQGGKSDGGRAGCAYETGLTPDTATADVARLLARIQRAEEDVLRRVEEREQKATQADRSQARRLLTQLTVAVRRLPSHDEAMAWLERVRNWLDQGACN